MTAPRPDLEKIAALLDGRLSPAERDALLREAAESRDTIEVIAAAREALSDAGDLSAWAPSKSVAAQGSAPLFRRSAFWALAAAIVIAVIIPLMRQRGVDRANDPGIFAMTLATQQLPTDWSSPQWAVSRSGIAELMPGARAVRIGARLSDFELAAASGDSATALLAAEVAMLATELPGSVAVIAAYRDSPDRMLGRTSDAVQARSGWAAALATLAGSELVTTGAWLESARIAASRADTAFFRSNAWKGGLAAAGAALQEDAESLRQLESLHSAVAASQPDFQAVRAAAEGLLRRLG